MRRTSPAFSSPRAIFKGIPFAAPARSGAGDFRFPAISPDGRTLAYAACWGEGCDLYVIGLDEQLVGRGEPTRLTSQSAAAIYGLSWAADGRSLVYGSW